MVDLHDLHRPSVANTWCPGCGNHALLSALKKAIVKLKLNPEQVVVTSGIGCSSNLPHWLNTYGFHGVHGRALPVAFGIKMANHKLEVITAAGDGDTYGEGTGHFIHALRRNLDMTFICHDNQIYGLTQGQTSPTSMKGMETKSTPFGAIEEPFNPLLFALVSDATFVARGYAGDLLHLADIFADAIKHKGFSVVDVFQPCVSFNKWNTFEWFKERVYKLEETKYKPNDRMKAIKKAQEMGKKIPIGILYKKEKKTYHEYLPQIAKKPLVKQRMDNVSIKRAMEEFF